MRVLVVDDEPVARARIVRLLARIEDVEVVGEASSGQEALRLDGLEARRGPLGFLRASRGALVRRDAITAYDVASGGTLVLESGERVPVSRRAAPVIRAALGI